MRFSGRSKIDIDVERHLRGLGENLRGRVVVDLPAGRGRMSRVLQELGAKVEPYDLFPEPFKVESLQCRPADLNERLPIEDAHADYVLFQEGIEHLPNQLFALQEMSRILKPGGRLLLTTPNISNLRARMAAFLLEGDLTNKLPRNELDSVWGASDDSQRLYFGHLFLIGIQRLRALARVAGFRLRAVHGNKVSYGSLLLGIFYPLMAMFGIVAYLSSARQTLVTGRHDPETIRDSYREIMRLNLHPNVLFGKKLFVEFEKSGDAAAATWARDRITA